MNDKLTYILNDDKQNYPFSFSRLKLLVKSLETTSLEATNVKVPKVFKPTVKIKLVTKLHFNVHAIPICKVVTNLQ